KPAIAVPARAPLRGQGVIPRHHVFRWGGNTLHHRALNSRTQACGHATDAQHRGLYLHALGICPLRAGVLSVVLRYIPNKTVLIALPLRDQSIYGRARWLLR